MAAELQKRFAELQIALELHSKGREVFFRIVGGARTSAPACATGDYWMIRDENSNAGKQQYAMLLAAQASGKVVNAVGSNTCTRWVNGEDVDYIQIND